LLFELVVLYKGWEGGEGRGGGGEGRGGCGEKVEGGITPYP